MSSIEFVLAHNLGLRELWAEHKFVNQHVSYHRSFRSERWVECQARTKERNMPSTRLQHRSAGYKIRVVGGKQTMITCATCNQWLRLSAMLKARQQQGPTCKQHAWARMAYGYVTWMEDSISINEAIHVFNRICAFSQLGASLAVSWKQVWYPWKNQKTTCPCSAHIKPQSKTMPFLLSSLLK